MVSLGSSLWVIETWGKRERGRDRRVGVRGGGGDFWSLTQLSEIRREGEREREREIEERETEKILYSYVYMCVLYII
jgi:hypothetical protein